MVCIDLGWLCYCTCVSTGYAPVVLIRHIVVVGTGEQAAVVSQRLQRSTWFGLEISAFYGEVEDEVPSWLKHKRLLENLEELRRYVDKQGVDQVWISLSHNQEDVIRKVILALKNSSVENRYVPDIFEYQLMHHSLSEIAGVPVVIFLIPLSMA